MFRLNPALDRAALRDRFARDRRVQVANLLQEEDAAALLEDLHVMIARALDQVRATPAATLLDARGIGRQQVPSNVIGLLFHGAEHATRHAGQAISTARIVKGRP